MAVIRISDHPWDTWTTARDAYLCRRLPGNAGKWREKARAAIVAVLQADGNQHDDTVRLLEAVDAAYPFGPRKHHPYKAWLEERRVLVDCLYDVLPSPAEWGAIEVAIDMEQEGRPEADIVALLDEQAPHRHGRACKTCGAAKGKPCREPNVRLELASWDNLGHVHRRDEFTDRLIPHAARCQP